jgi:hypothetical protein
MICDTNTATEFELKRLRAKWQRYERTSNDQLTTSAIKMIVGDWYVDELGVLTREITARELRFYLSRMADVASSEAGGDLTDKTRQRVAKNGHGDNRCGRDHIDHSCHDTLLE